MCNDSIIQSDVIVIGAGPGGIAAAITCAHAGLQVTIISNEPVNDKPNTWYPSESLHPGVISLLNELGITALPPHVISGIYKGIKVLDRYTALGADDTGEWEGMHICRPLFNSFLQETATQHGVTTIQDKVIDILQHENRVTGVKLESGLFAYAKFVVDGSGRKRLAGKKMKFNENYYSPPLVAWSGVTQHDDSNPLLNEQATFIPCATGWTWLAPHYDNCCTWTRLAITHQQKPELTPLLQGCRQLGEIRAANMRWRAFRPLCVEGLILTGDAAAVIDPAAGQGILNALWTGIYAGKTVASCITNPAYESLYLAGYDQWFIEQYEEKISHLRDLYKEHGILGI